MKKIIAALKSRILEEAEGANQTQGMRKRLTWQANVALSLIGAAGGIAVAANFYPVTTWLVLQAAGILLAAGAAAASLLKSKPIEEVQSESFIVTPKGEKITTIQRQLSREVRIGLCCLIVGLVASFFAKGIEQYLTNKRNQASSQALQSQMQLLSNSLENTKAQLALAQRSLNEMERLIARFETLRIDSVQIVLPTNDVSVQEFWEKLIALASDPDSDLWRQTVETVTEEARFANNTAFRAFNFDLAKFSDWAKQNRKPFSKFDVICSNFLKARMHLHCCRINVSPKDLINDTETPPGLSATATALGKVSMHINTLQTNRVRIRWREINFPRELWITDGSVICPSDFSDAQLSFFIDSPSAPVVPDISITNLQVSFGGVNYPLENVTQQLAGDDRRRVVVYSGSPRRR